MMFVWLKAIYIDLYWCHRSHETNNATTWVKINHFLKYWVKNKKLTNNDEEASVTTCRKNERTGSPVRDPARSALPLFLKKMPSAEFLHEVIDRFDCSQSCVPVDERLWQHCRTACMRLNFDRIVYSFDSELTEGVESILVHWQWSAFSISKS